MSDYPTCPECFGRKTVNGHYCNGCDGLGWMTPAESTEWYARAILDEDYDPEYAR
jgi:DnaJ-class molecular chaperone